ncbi:hypothetical protein FNH13_17655 [Ornithinimicrobium ciconiae]|uniref:FtsK domain-containing protein n=1 Tax=Ornithinimicrobium ciconiae TaxID=2594265 RepID=A0A516GEG5_9MICO|nr:FtsK/SpoIIIE domain-containing protein [Ornithinimicrobium ciconiae]QDO89927.1 hypothetical protein FNH13_17655 [Ornithinimicrobium ciconiae]
MSELTIPLPEAYHPREHRDRVAGLIACRAPGYVTTRVDAESRTAWASPTLPGKVDGTLSENCRVQDLDTLAVRVADQGLVLSGADVPARSVTLARLTPAQQTIRSRIATRLRCQPWEVELAIGARGTGEVTDVVVTRWPDAGMPAAKAQELWLEVARQVVGHPGWTRRIVGQRVEMHSEPRPTWPNIPVPWDEIRAAPWHRLFLGHDEKQRPVWGDLTATPQAMVTGRTGSGKSVMLELMLCGMLLRGWDLRVCEPVKSGLDFRHLRPFCSRWATTRVEVAEVMTELAAEIDRRLAVMLEHGAPRWDELPEAVRETEGIHPICVVHDELESAAQEIQTAGLRGAELMRAQTDAEAVMTTRALYSRLLREARYVGIHLVLSTQRWTNEALGSAASGWRANAGLRIAMGRMNLTTLSTSILEVDACQVAYERAFGALGSDGDEPDDDPVPIKGRGIVELDYADPVSFQTPWPGTHAEQAAMLRSHGVPEREQMTLVPQFGPPPGFGQDAVKDLGTLDDLDLDLADLEG